MFECIDVYQDGADFYCEASGSLLVTAPFQIGDGDLDTAITARRWFVQNWCPANEIEPNFV